MDFSFSWCIQLEFFPYCVSSLPSYVTVDTDFCLGSLVALVRSVFLERLKHFWSISEL